MEDLTKKAREFINDHLLTTTLSTVDENKNIDVSIVNSILMTDPETLKVAHLSTKKSYENLKATGKGTFMILVPTDDPLKTDSIRITAELIKEDTAGEDFNIMQAFVNENFGGFKIKYLLTFRITEIKSARD